jgi:hypothetical protein
MLEFQRLRDKAELIKIFKRKIEKSHKCPLPNNELALKPIFQDSHLPLQQEDTPGGPGLSGWELCRIIKFLSRGQGPF